MQMQENVSFETEPAEFPVETYMVKETPEMWIDQRESKSELTSETTGEISFVKWKNWIQWNIFFFKRKERRKLFWENLMAWNSALILSVCEITRKLHNLLTMCAIREMCMYRGSEVSNFNLFSESIVRSCFFYPLRNIGTS